MGLIHCGLARLGVPTNAPKPRSGHAAVEGSDQLPVIVLILETANGIHLQTDHRVAEAFHVLAEVVDSLVLVDEVTSLRAPLLLQIEAVKFGEFAVSLLRIVIGVHVRASCIPVAERTELLRILFEEALGGRRSMVEGDAFVAGRNQLIFPLFRGRERVHRPLGAWPSDLLPDRLE